jgi:hypothetical protein
MAGIQLCIKQQALTAMIILLQKFHKAQAQSDIPKSNMIFDYYKGMSTTELPKSILFPNIIIEHKINPLDVLIFSCLFTITIYILYKLYQKNHHRFQTKVLIEIGNRDKRIQFTILTLPHAIEHYTFTATKFITSIKITGKLTPEIQIVWPELIIEHKTAQIQFTIPKTKRISLFTARQIRSITTNSYYCLIFTKDANGIMRLAPLLQTDCLTRSQNDV